VLFLLVILAVLLAFSIPALIRFINWLLSHAICFDYCAEEQT
jgi:hypothetical protein